MQKSIKRTVSCLSLTKYPQLNDLSVDKYKKKLFSYNKLLRINNVLPVFLLNILAGWLTIPNYKLFLNKNFWLFSVITQLTMMNSMVINDLFDLKIDLINNNDRPLVNKDISLKEARRLYISTNIIINILSVLFFHHEHFYKYILTINIILFLYTPFFKKIIFVKNLTCASIVSSTIILTSKSILLDNNSISVFPLIENPYFNVINFTSVFLFLSSLYIELLLDIKDINGDKENNIITVPNYFGIKKTLNFLIILFTANLTHYSNILYRNRKYKLLFGFILSNIHFFKNLFQLIKHTPFTDKKILHSVKDTTISLVIFILCLLSPF
jgi:4-hydroxybenzoate polyprenyltransferase